MRKGVLVMLSVFAALLGACSSGRPQPSGAKPESAAAASGEAHSAGADAVTGTNAPGAAMSAAESSEITRVHFLYDVQTGDQHEMDIWVESVSEDGADAEVMKRVGPRNYTGRKKTGSIRMSAEQTAELLEILGRYDLEGFAALPYGGTVTGALRSLYVFYGERKLYIAWNAHFPKTLPPEEDVMYCELYNFFERMIDGEPGWEEVRSAMLEDPRNNPAYGERIVSWFGHDVRLVPGTGVRSGDGSGAAIDYGDKAWWDEEGFSGTWALTDRDRAERYCTDPETTLAVGRDGSVTLCTGGLTWTGMLPDTRYYKSGIEVLLENKREGERRFTVRTVTEEDYARLRVCAYPDPYPTEQFDETDVHMTRQE